MTEIPGKPPLPTPATVARGRIVTRDSWTERLRALGVREGGVLCVHSSLSGLGFVIGGARTAIDGLSDAVGESGTLMMPAFSGDNSDPAQWRYPAVPPEMVDVVRQSLPPFDPLLTPTRKMGAIAELFRNRHGTVRSAHPQSSFCANGPLASRICENHSFAFRFGRHSPLGALVELRGQVLLAGAPWDTVSLFYLSEFEMPDRAVVRHYLPVPIGTRNEWREFDELVYPNMWYDAVLHLIRIGMARHVVSEAGQLVLFDAAEALAEVTRWRLDLMLNSES